MTEVLSLNVTRRELGRRGHTIAGEEWTKCITEDKRRGIALFIVFYEVHAASSVCWCRRGKAGSPVGVDGTRISEWGLPALVLSSRECRVCSLGIWVAE